MTTLKSTLSELMKIFYLNKGNENNDLVCTSIKRIKEDNERCVYSFELKDENLQEVLIIEDLSFEAIETFGGPLRYGHFSYITKSKELNIEKYDNALNTLISILVKNFKGEKFNEPHLVEKALVINVSGIEKTVELTEEEYESLNHISIEIRDVEKSIIV